MLHIIVAGKPADSNLEELLQRFDRTFDRQEREAIATEIYNVMGGRLRSMVQRAAQGRQLTDGEVVAFTWRALWKGLSESGLSNLKRSDGIDENLVERLKDGSNPVSVNIWSRLSSALRQELDARYLKATTANLLAGELNNMLRSPDMFDQATIQRLATNPEARELAAKSTSALGLRDLTRLNALVFAAAFGLPSPERPESNLLGYISAAVMPRLRAEMSGGTGASRSRHVAEVSGDIRPDIEGVRSLEAQGKLPDEWSNLSEAQRIYEYRKSRLQREYGPARDWYTQQVTTLQPQNPFVVRDKPSLARAKELLAEHGVPQATWPRLPSSALDPVGVQSIQRVLDAERPRVVRFDDVQPPAVRAPGAPQQPAIRLFNEGRQSRAYQYLLSRVIHPDTAEFAVGRFIAGNPRATPQQVGQFLAGLPEDIRDDIEAVGWDSIVRDVDREVLRAAQNPALQTELMAVLNMKPETLTAAVNAVRVRILVRAVRSLR